MKRILIFSFMLSMFVRLADAQVSTKLPVIHSHNDYHQDAPFWKAYEAGAKLIEVDIFLQEGQLLVGHEEKELAASRTLEKLYFKPLEQLFLLGKSIEGVNLLIDLKGEAVSTLKALVELAQDYPDLFGKAKQPVFLIISGNRPPVKDYANYPDFIVFDARSPEDITATSAPKIALISRNFSDFSKWKGEGTLAEKDSLILAEFIQACHQKDKPVRFWNTVDCLPMYQTLINLSVDFINTDDPVGVRLFFEESDETYPVKHFEKYQ